MLLELSTATRLTPPALLTNLVNPALGRAFANPPLLPFQFLILARKINIAIFIAIAQLGPMFRSSDGASESDELLPERLAHLENLASSNEVEASRLLDLSMAPYASDAAAVKSLKERMSHWLVQNTIRADPGVREAERIALQRRRGKEAR